MCRRGGSFAPPELHGRPFLPDKVLGAVRVRERALRPRFIKLPLLFGRLLRLVASGDCISATEILHSQEKNMHLQV